MTELKPHSLVGCLGVMCPMHGNCQKYLAVNGAINAPRPIGTCDPERKTWPGYIPVEVKS